MTSPPAGWYPDPANPQAQRYWNGIAWSEQAHPVSSPPRPDAGPSGYPPAPGYPPVPAYGAQPSQASGSATLLQRNQIAAMTVGVCVLYAVIAFYAHFVFIGILPIILTTRSFRRHEPLAAVALIATVIAVIISLVALSR